MVKIHTTLSIEDSIIKRAKELQINISEFLSRKLRERITPTKEQIAEKNKIIKCTVCSAETTDDLFYCEESEKVFCPKCHLQWDTYDKCKPYYNKLGEHIHIRIPGFEGQHSAYISKIDQGASNEEFTP